MVKFHFRNAFINILSLLCVQQLIWCVFYAPAEFFDLLPEDAIPKNCLTFRHVVPVSATTGLGVDHLKRCIRESLDEEAERENKAIHEERLRALRNQ